MIMQPGFEILKGKKLAGMRAFMTLSMNRTEDLWRSFMPRRKEIKNIAGSGLYSVGIYHKNFFTPFNPETEFEKWAAVEVTDVNILPDGMNALILTEGLYAVFIHKGPAAEGPGTYDYIFRSWLPGSGFGIDDRPHFAFMGEKYKKDDPASEEEIWIPLKPVN